MTRLTPDASHTPIELLLAGRMAEAENAARQILRADPSHGPSLHCLGLIAQQRGQYSDAVQLISRAVASNPGVAEYHYNLALALSAINDLPAAEMALRQAITINPRLVEAHTNLGALLSRKDDIDGAISNFRQAISLQPEAPLGYLNLGKILRGLDRLDEAELNFRQAIRLSPRLAPAWNMLGSCLRESGRIGEAVAAFSQAVHVDPRLRAAHSNLCYALYFDPAATPTGILETHRQWARQFAPDPAPIHLKYEVELSPERRLRIGYSSPNFQSHAVASFLEPIFKHHDKSRFEIVAYSDTQNPDQQTSKLKSLTALWRGTNGLNDQAFADLVRSDHVDILIDLTLHMRGCRLGAFALRPAPVQLTHLAYCGTSGLSQLDGCITDVNMANGNNAFFSEPLLPLPHSYWCYQPSEIAPNVGPLPASRNGFITFGSFNSLAKVNDRVIAVWAQILSRIPKSRLALFTPGAEVNPTIAARFERLGIPTSRIDPFSRKAYPEYFEGYNQIDVALDPFPYNGGTTTLDALWMGVPVVTLAGSLPVGRAGVSILTNLGLENLIAASEDEYIQRTVDLSSDLNTLASLRSNLRLRISQSPLVDAPRYTKELENIYRKTWQTWVRKQTH